MDHRAIFVDARLRGHDGDDGELAILVIPAKACIAGPKACLAGPKAGFQTNYPNILRSYAESSKT